MRVRIRTRIWLALLNAVIRLCFLYGRVWTWAHGRKWPTAQECKQTARLLGLDAESLSAQPHRGSNTIQ
jgi:hypothetical protein